MAKPKVPGSPLRSGPDPAKASYKGLTKAALARLKPINPPRMTGTAAHAGKARDDVIAPRAAPKRSPAEIARHRPAYQVGTANPRAKLDASQIQDRRGQYKGPPITGGWSKPVGPAYPIPRSPRYPNQPPPTTTSKPTYGPPTPKPKRKYKM